MNHLWLSIVLLIPGGTISFSLMSSTGTTQTKTKMRVDWIVRPTTADDGDAVTELLSHCYGTILAQDYSQEILAKALPIIAKANPELLTCGTWYIVQHPTSQQVVGCGGWTRSKPKIRPKDDDESSSSSPTTTEKQHPPPNLRHFATHPDWLRQGVATALWQKIVDTMKNDPELATDSSDCCMEVFSTLTAQSFYASLGFQPMEQLNITLGDDCLFPAVLMRRIGKLPWTIILLHLQLCCYGKQALHINISCPLSIRAVEKENSRENKFSWK